MIKIIKEKEALFKKKKCHNFQIHKDIMRLQEARWPTLVPRNKKSVIILPPHP